MDQKRLKSIDVVVTGKNDLYEVTAIRHCNSPLYVNIGKAVLVERLTRLFPELSFHINVVRVHE